jgi:K+-sensing histidine kinase KdpD
MSPQSLSKLFIDFNKMEEGESMNTNGVGLGLSICKNLIEHMAGSVKVESKLKAGTTFTITFKTTCIIDGDDPERFIEPALSNSSIV